MDSMSVAIKDRSNVICVVVGSSWIRNGRRHDLRAASRISSVIIKSMSSKKGKGWVRDKKSLGEVFGGF